MYLFIKRILDLIFASFAILVFSPLIIVVYIFLFCVNGGKPFFYQIRPGHKGKVFKIIKFKTMNDKKDSRGNLLPDRERMTNIGLIIRKSSLDELPQLFNVFIGDMSIIGPRPLLPQYLELYSVSQARRHEVKPGITGWAQVNGRNAISWNRKFELDVYYVDNLSFMLDVKIFFLTIKKVFIREGISQEGQATAEAFNGNN